MTAASRSCRVFRDDRKKRIPWRSSVKYRLLPHLACPACRRPDLSLRVTRAENRPAYSGHFSPHEGELPGVDTERREEAEVIEGALLCEGCGRSYPVRDGIPRMLPDGVPVGP